MEFPPKPKTDWQDYCKKNKLVAFQRDLNAKFSKIIVVDSYESIFEKIKNGDNNYYDYWDSHGCYKFFIDYDKKVDPNKSEPDHVHKTDILNIISYIREVIPNIKDVVILKSIPDDTKKSYHVIFTGAHFSSKTNMKNFVEGQLQSRFKDLFSKKIFDSKVYGDICFRSLLCNKFGQERRLFMLKTQPFVDNLEEIPIGENEITIDDFKRACITYVDDNSVAYTYKSNDKKQTNKKVHLMSDGDIYTDKEIVKKYLDILDTDRYIDRNKWLNVGYILHSINKDYDDLWHYFSCKWEHYSESDCDIAWKSFNNSEYNYTVLNLMHLARVDNREEFAEITKDIPNHDIKYLKPFDNIISKYIYRLYHEKFVCSNPEKNEWYYFDGIRWVKENKSFNLRKLTINEVFAQVENYRRELIKDNNVNEELIKNYHNILKILGSGYKLNCLELEFYNSKFYQIIDQNKDLIGFENGVFDLNNMEFRAGEPGDYVSMTTGYEYKRYPVDSFEYAELMDLIYKILPRQDVRHFTLKSLASCLDGHIRDENFYIFSGKNNTGGNGKSTIMDLLQKALGDYCCTSPVTLVTSKRESSNSANSALANIKNKRSVIMQEPESNEMIQAGIMKALTGGDKISTRELHSTQMEFRPNAKFFMCCNKIPAISDLDGGVVRRLKITEFVSRFVENPDPENLKNGIHEFKIDRDLKSKLDSYKSVFMSILLDYYMVYKQEGLEPPTPVLQVTKKYENDNNAIKQFVDENIVRGDKNDFITKDQFKTMYQSDSIIRSTFGKFNNFIKQLENNLCIDFKADRKGVVKLAGWRIRQAESDTESDDEFFRDDDDELSVKNNNGNSNNNNSKSRDMDTSNRTILDTLEKTHYQTINTDIKTCDSEINKKEQSSIVDSSSKNSEFNKQLEKTEYYSNIDSDLESESDVDATSKKKNVSFKEEVVSINDLKQSVVSQENNIVSTTTGNTAFNDNYSSDYGTDTDSNYEDTV